MTFGTSDCVLTRRLRAGRLIAGVIALGILPTMMIADGPRAMAAENPIVVENAEVGTNSWIFLTQGNDAAGQIKGYASATSVNQNENITFYVSVNPAQTLTIAFYFLCWVGGRRGRAL